MKPRFAYVPVDDIEVGENVRQRLGDIEELVASIRQHGVLEPIVICPSEEGDKPEVLFGQRRLAAARQAGLEEVPCLMRPRPPEVQRILMQLAENFEREDMTELDEALTFQRLVGLGVTQASIAKAVNRSQTHVSHRLKILGWPGCVRVAIDLGWVTFNAADEIPAQLLGESHRAGLVKALRGGNEVVRRWISATLSDRERRIAQLGGRRPVNLRPETFELAQGRARALGLTLGGYVAQLIERDVQAAQGSTERCAPCRGSNHSNCTGRGCHCTHSVHARQRVPA